MNNKHFKLPFFYFVSGTGFDKNKNHIETIEKILKGGAGIVQLREKNISDKKLLKMAMEIRKLTSRYNAFFIVNDRPDIACLAEADGVHAGQDDLSVKDLRKIVGKNKIIGKSTHSLKQAVEAEKEGADYIGVGPIFNTDSKKGVCLPVGLRLISDVKSNIKIPFVAIGGIKHYNVDKVLAQGAQSIAVITGVLTENPEKAVRDFIGDRIL
ncbi:MAG: thiamine phosphate synthase [Candidatus Muiribacteriota bacterium]